MDTYDQDDADTDADDQDADEPELTPEELKLFGFLCRSFLQLSPEAQERVINEMGDPDMNVVLEKVKHFLERN